MRYLKQEDIDKVKELRNSGWSMIRIARQFDVCQATVSNILRGKTQPRRRKKLGRPARDPYAPVDFKEEDLSAYPDDAYFQHVRIWDFIG